MVGGGWCCAVLVIGLWCDILCFRILLWLVVNGKLW